MKKIERREFISTSVTAGAGIALIGPHLLNARTNLEIADMKTSQSHQVSKSMQRIDVHHHILPPDYLTALQRAGIDTTTFPDWTPQRSLDVMDKNGIDIAITSISSPGVYIGDGGTAQDLARRCNTYSAQLVNDNPNRFGAFASLPLPNLDATLAEIEYSLGTLGLDGVILPTNVAGEYVGGAHQSGIFAELNRRKAVVLIHPNDAPNKAAVSNAFVEYPIDVTRAFAQLLISETLVKFPDIRFILTHAGGNVPFFADRVGKLYYMRGSKPRLGRIIVDLIKKRDGGLNLAKGLYYDLAASTSRYVLAPLQELVPPEQILFGSNYGWAPESVVAAAIKELSNYDGFDDRALAKVERDSALVLFPRFCNQG